MVKHLSRLNYVGHCVMDEIINSNSKNMRYNVRKETVLAFEGKPKVVYNLIQKKL